MARKKNPETGTVVAMGFGALALGVLGFLGYKAWRKEPAQPAPDDWHAQIPAFDPASKDMDHAYIFSVTTDAPLPADADLAIKGMPVVTWLESQHVRSIVVLGPLSKEQVEQQNGALSPAPDIVVAVSLAGIILDALSREHAEELKALFASLDAKTGGAAGVHGLPS